MSEVTGMRILHVDDDPDLVELVADMLEREDGRFTVQTATSASGGLDQLNDTEYDCIVSDYDMPGQNGIEFLEAVREDNPNLPFILYTGKGSEEVASDAISAGVTDYLQKEAGTDQYKVLANRIINAVESYRSQQRLAERNRDLRRYKHMINSMYESACIYDEEERFVIVNDFLANWYDTTREELEGEYSKLIPMIREQTDDGDPFQALFDGQRDRLSGEIEAEFPGHGHAVLEYRLTPLTVDGSVEGVVGVTRDITKRKKREEELRRTERQFEALFNDPNILVGLIDTEGTVIDINETAIGYIDAELEDVTGDPFWETPWFTGDETIQQAVRESIDQATSGEYVEFEVDLSEAVDDSLIVSGVIRPVENEDGEVVSLLISDRDITERKEHQQELEQTNTVLSTLFETLPVGVLAGDADRNVLAVNERMFDLFEFPGSPDEITGADCEKLAQQISDLFVEPEQFVKRINELVTERESVRNEELSLQDGRTFARDHEPLKLPDGDGHLWVYRDITDLKDREKSLQRERDRLDEFASVVSHDLQNPLTVAEGRLELAQKECDSEHLEAIETALHRIDRITEDILWLAREGRDIGSMDEVVLQDAIDAAWNIAADRTEHAELQYADEGFLTVGIADDDRLRQLLENLFTNAIEHGGEDVTVTVGVVDTGFYVEDDGPGIPDDRRDEVFTAGYSTSQEGTGFGLSIVMQIAEAHDWEVQVVEGTEGGARFEITGVEFTAE